jgi:AbrB family looped-hinge helix DNA binding protein
MSRMTAKGQVTIPKRLCDYLGLKPGAKVDFALAGRNIDGQLSSGVGLLVFRPIQLIQHRISSLVLPEARDLFPPWAPACAGVRCFRIHNGCI